MRIGFVCYPTFGGSGVVATELGKALAAKGHELHFITYSTPARMGSLKSNLFYHEVRVTDYPLFDFQPYESVLTSKMVEIAINYRLDILHVHYAIPHASAAIMARSILATKGIHLPIVTTLHGTDITLLGKDPAFEPVICYAINESDAVTAVSKSLKQDTYDHFGTDKKIEVIPNFICPSQYDGNPDEHFRSCIAPKGEPILTHISNFRPVKRIQDVLQVFARIRQAMPSKLLLVGDGPERSSMEHLVKKLGLLDDVTFIGKIKNPIEPLRVSDLFLLTSETESFGLAALEAMASGVPVIASNKGGIPEVIQHGQNGFLHEVGDVVGMATSAISLLENTAMLGQFRIQAKLRSLDFNIDHILPQYEAVYDQLVPHA